MVENEKKVSEQIFGYIKKFKTHQTNMQIYLTD